MSRHARRSLRPADDRQAGSTRSACRSPGPCCCWRSSTGTACGRPAWPAQRCWWGSHCRRRSPATCRCCSAVVSLLRTAAAAEAVLRVGVFALLFLDVGIWWLVACIVVMNITAWTGYAGMRAEVAAVAPGPRALTAVRHRRRGRRGARCRGSRARCPPASCTSRLSTRRRASSSSTCSPCCRPCSLPGGRAIAPGVREPGRSPARSRPSLPLVAGVLLMAIASAPTLLCVAAGRRAARSLVGRRGGDRLHGRLADGSLRGGRGGAAGCQRADHVDPVRARDGGPVAVGPRCSIAVLCAAQLLSGQFMTTLEGLLDARTAEQARGPSPVRSPVPRRAGRSAPRPGRPPAVRAGRRGALGRHRAAWRPCCSALVPSSPPGPVEVAARWSAPRLRCSR